MTDRQNEVDAATAATEYEDDERAPRKFPIEVSAGLVAWMIRNRVSLAFSSYQHGDLYFLGAQSDGRAVFSRAPARAAGSAAAPR